MPRKTRTNQSGTIGAQLEQLRHELQRPAAVLTDAAYEQAERMGVRHLTIEHLGRWIELAPKEGGDVGILKTTAGRLVGIRPARNPRASYPSRDLIIQSGSVTERIDTGLDHPVLVAPRTWS